MPIARIGSSIAVFAVVASLLSLWIDEENLAYASIGIAILGLGLAILAQFRGEDSKRDIFISATAVILTIGLLALKSYLVLREFF